MSEFAKRNQELPEEFRNTLVNLHSTRDSRLPLVLWLGKENGWTLAAMARGIGLTTERVRQLVMNADHRVGGHIPEVPLPLRRASTTKRPGRRRLTVKPEVATMLRSMAEVAARVNGGTPSNAQERRVSEEFTSLLHSLTQQGVTTYHLSQVLGVRPAAVYSRLARHGYREASPSLRERSYKGRPSPRSELQEKCKRGHPLSGANLYVIPRTGGRVCRKCDGLRKAKYLAALKARQIEATP